MTNSSDGDDIEAWFRARGFEIELSEESGEWWATLSGGTLTVPKYGRGSTPDEALRRARTRYVEEQETA